MSLMLYRFQDLTNFSTPPVFDASVQRNLSEFMRDIYIAAIYGHEIIFLLLTRWV